MRTTPPGESLIASRRLVLDLFCGEGGMAEGLRRAGFTPVGVDTNEDYSRRRFRPRPKPLRRYPFESIEADALDFLRALLSGQRIGWGGYALDDFAGIHASPPCQLFSPMTRVNGGRRDGNDHPDLICPTRELLEQTGLPYCIENVPEAPLRSPAILCGSMFGLDVRRHRGFETNWPLAAPRPCRHEIWTPRFPQRDYRRGRNRDFLMSVVPVYGGTRFAGDRALRRRAMQIDWMTIEGLNEAIPPAYSEWIGQQWLEHLEPSLAVA